MLLEKEKFYVYLHRRASDGVVFYVGKGTGTRAYSKERSKFWSDFIKDVPYEVLFERINMTNSAAIELESYLIDNPREGWDLVNKKRSSKIKAIDYSIVSKYVEYDESSPTCLRWKIDIGRENSVSYRKKGSPAGSLNTERNRYVITINGVIYMLHRVVVTLHGIIIPENYYINHKDCNPSNNRIENLEVVPPAVNSQKKTEHVYHADTTGIRVIDRKSGYSVLCRYVGIDGKRISKSIIVESKDDIENASRELIAWRNEQIKKKIEILMTN